MKNAMQLKAIIKNIAKEKHISAQLVLQNYMLERFLERVFKACGDGRIAVQRRAVVCGESLEIREFSASAQSESVWICFHTQAVRISLKKALKLSVCCPEVKMCD